MLKLAIPVLAAMQGARKTPVFLVGTQRSGTTMLTDILGRVPLCRAYHEGDERVMSDMRLRERGVIRDVINEEIRPFQVFKPINGSMQLTSQGIGAWSAPPSSDCSRPRASPTS